MNLRPKTALLTVLTLFWLGLGALPAQVLSQCFDFEQVPADAQFGANFGQTGGDTILEQDDLLLTIDSFFYDNGESSLSLVSITQENLPFAFGQLLFPSNASVTIRPNLDIPFPASFCFDFFYYGGSLNLGVNDQKPFIFDDLNDLLAISKTDIFPGIEVIADLAPTDGFPIQGRICLKGAIYNLTIGGQELAIDNLCLDAKKTPDCPWSEVKVQPLTCSEEGFLELSVVFPPDGPLDNSGYYIDLEGTTFGPFSYREKDITLGPIPINDADQYELIVFDPDFPNCSYRTNVLVACPSAPCPVTDIEVFIDDCDDSHPGTDLVINFDYNSSLARRFLLEIGGLVRDSFSTDQLPLRLNVPFDIPSTIPIEVHLCFEVESYNTPCCFNLMLSRKECEPDDNCITFETLDADSRYGANQNDPGTIIFTEDRVPVGISPFILNDSTQEYFFTKVYTKEEGDIFQRASGQYLFISNNNLTFYFSRSQRPTNQVCLDFFEGGGLLNLGINGRPVKTLANMKEALDVEWPDGIKASIHYDSSASNLRQGTLCLKGDIEQLTIGGQELGLDNVCFDYIDEEICPISHLKAKTTACDADGLFFVDLFFDLTGPAGEGFHVYQANGQLLGSFAYEEDSVRVGPFNAYSRDLLYLIVQDKRNPACAEKILVDKPTDCTNDCGLGGLQVDILNCYNQLFYDLKIDLAHFPDSNQDATFRLLIEGRDFGTYSFADLPLELNQVDIYTEATFFPVEICVISPETGAESCCIRATVDKKDCLSPCRMGPIDIVEKYCSDEGALFVVLDFEHQNTSEYFVLERNGQTIGRYAYTELPIKVGPLYPTTADRPVVLSVYDARRDDCSSSLVIDEFPCQSLPCEMGAIKVVDRYCDHNGQAIWVIDFDHARTSGTFTLTVNNRELGVYHYRELPLKVGPFTPSPEDYLELKAKDNTFPDCFTYGKLETFPCVPVPCTLGELIIKDRGCTDDGERYIWIDLEYKGVSDSFFLAQDEQIIGRFAYRHLPLKVKLNPFNNLAAQVQLSAFDAGQDSCSTTTTFDPYPCEPLPCKLGDIKILERTCTDDGVAFAKIDFSYQGVSDSFYVFINGQPVRRYHYKHLPIKVELPDMSPNKTYDIKILDAGKEGCSTGITMEGYFCEPVPCSLGDIRILERLCTDAGEAYVVIDFDYQGVSDSFYVALNGPDIARYHYKHLPIRVKLPNLSNDRTYKILVQDAKSDDCTTEMVIEGFPCEPVPCKLGDIQLLERVCTDDGVAYMKFDFDYQGVSDSFFAFVNGDLVGRYHYNHLPIKLKMTNHSASARYEVAFVDSGSDACFTSSAFEGFDCEPVPCALGEIEVLEKRCTSNGQAAVLIDFKYAGVSDSFLLYTNRQFKQRYHYKHLPLWVELEPTNATGEGTHILIKDLENEDCAVDINVDPFPCNTGDCYLDNLHIVEKYCEDGQLYLVINFDYERVSESFVLLQNGNEIGTYRYDQLPIKVGPYYPPIAADVLELSVMDVEYQDCGTDLRLPALYCPDDCTIGNLELTQTPCGEDGTYFVELNFRHDMTSAGFQLIQNDQELGRFTYDELPIKLGPFDEPMPNGLFVKVKDLEHPNCYQEGHLDIQPCRTGECLLYKVETENIECTQETYHITLAYKGEGIMADDILVATFSSGYQFEFHGRENPVRITDIPLPANQRDVVTLCVKGRNDCCLTTDFDIPCANSCGLKDLKVETTECDEDGRFDLWVNVDYGKVSDGFTLFLNGRAYGNYMYADLPVKVRNLAGEPGKIYQVTVRDFSNFDCKITTRVEAPHCAENCGLAGVRIELDECADGYFQAYVIPEVIDNRSGSFLIFLGGELYGPYPNNTREIPLGPFPTTGQRYDLLLVDAEDPTCFAHEAFFAPDNCDELPDDCSIKNLDIRVVDCNPDGSYRVVIDFDVRNAGNKYFDLYDRNGNIIDYFAVADLPLDIDLRLDGETEATLGVCINDRNDCCARTTVLLPDCTPQSNCFLDRIKVGTTECDANGNVFVVLESGLEASSNQQIEVILNGAVVDTIRFDVSGVVRVGPLSPGIGRELFLLLGSLTSNECFREIALNFPDCDDFSDVWPGDANKDNIANYIDLINVGVAYGARGFARSDNRTDWQNIPGTAWNQFFATGLNYKHADCNGDGVIDARDIGIIMRNYNQTNGVVEVPDTLPATDLDPPIVLDLPPGGHLGSNDPRIKIPIVLGDADRPVKDLYGLAFVIDFDPTHINPATVEVDVLTSWLGEPGVNLASIDYTDVQNGRIEVAISRTDQNEVSGFGPIALLRGIKDDIAGITTEVYLRHGRRTRVNLEEDGLGGGGFEISFTDPSTDPGLVDLDNSLTVHPNPASDRVRVTSTYALPIQALQIVGTDGRQVTRMVENDEWISVAELPKGVYVLRITIADNIIHKKLVVK